MSEQGTDKYGAEYKRTSNDFHFRLLEQDNCVCSICHGTGAKIEFEYVTRDYRSARQKGKICKNLQAHGHSFWICPTCIDNLVKKSKGLVKVLVKASPTGCSNCILDNTDACTRGAGRAVDDEACEDYLASPAWAEGSEE